MAAPEASLLQGRVLLTGASGGLGQAIARSFARRGASLVLTGRRSDVLEPLAGELGASTIECDLSDRRELDRLIEAAGAVDVLVANAALPASGLLNRLSQQQIDRILEVNLRAPVVLAHAFIPAMISRRRGHIVLISSLSGKVTSPASSMYSATKFALRGFGLGLREDLRRHGIGVSVVLPGFIRDAGMFAESGARLPRWLRTRSPEEVGEAVIRAVVANRAEVAVAPLGLRLGAEFGSVAPAVAAAVSRRLGSERIADQLVEGQKDKR